MAVFEYKLPDPGEGLTEAEIVSWQVKVGDVVRVNDVVVEIETAKSLVELPSPYAGEVTALLVPEGETVPVGTPIIAISDGAAEPAEHGEPAGPTGPAAPAAQPEMDLSNPSAGVENATLVGYGPKSGAARRRARRGPATARTDAGSATQLQVQGSFTLGQADTSEVVEGDEEPVPATAARETERSGEVRATGAWSVGGVLAKPPVRKRARELGVDLASVTPTGRGGVVTLADLESAASGTGEPDAAWVASSTSGTAGTAGTTGTADTAAPVATRPTLEDRREPIKGVRKMMGQAMVDSAFTVPHVTEWVTVDVTRTMKLVERLREDRSLADVKVSPLLVLARAVCLAARRTPEVNAHWDEAAQEVVFKGSVNLGIAAATPRGLVVPNVKGADGLDLASLGRAISALTATAREGRTPPADMAGGTFTITNVGVFGVDAGTPIINPGESAILCLGAVRRQPWVHKGKIRVRDVTTLALSFDHRFIDGAKGSQFLADVAAILEDPAVALRY